MQILQQQTLKSYLSRPSKVLISPYSSPRNLWLSLGTPLPGMDGIIKAPRATAHIHISVPKNRLHHADMYLSKDNKANAQDIFHLMTTWVNIHLGTGFGGTIGVFLNAES